MEVSDYVHGGFGMPRAKASGVRLTKGDAALVTGMAYVVFLDPNDIVIPWYLKEIANSVFHFMILAVYVTMLSMTYHYIIGAPDSGDGGEVPAATQ
ncbi:MAG: hypothetical protein O7D31_07825 [Alphaproteobacteria bacterium]|nr:hypothetical protein [Alphaproteobacteria bacterium]